MFKVSLYGYSADTFGYLCAVNIKEIDFEHFASDDIAIVVIEDELTRLKRYILGVNTQTEIVQNEALKGFFKAVTFHGGRNKKNWTNESKKQLEIALEMDPKNDKYRSAYDRLIQKINYNQNQFRSGNNYYSNQNADPNANRQMGGSACGTFADCCATYLCINCLCNSCR